MKNNIAEIIEAFNNTPWYDNWVVLSIIIISVIIFSYLIFLGLKYSKQRTSNQQKTFQNECACGRYK